MISKQTIVVRALRMLVAAFLAVLCIFPAAASDDKTKGATPPGQVLPQTAPAASSPTDSTSRKVVAAKKPNKNQRHAHTCTLANTRP